MRGRTPDDIEALIKRNQAQDMRGFFITDDNFARHPHWEEIADRIISLKKIETCYPHGTDRCDVV